MSNWNRGSFAKWANESRDWRVHRLSSSMAGLQKGLIRCTPLHKTVREKAGVSIVARTSNQLNLRRSCVVSLFPPSLSILPPTPPNSISQQLQRTDGLIRWFNRKVIRKRHATYRWIRWQTSGRSGRKSSSRQQWATCWYYFSAPFPSKRHTMMQITQNIRKNVMMTWKLRMMDIRILTTAGIGCQYRHLLPFDSEAASSIRFKSNF